MPQTTVTEVERREVFTIDYGLKVDPVEVEYDGRLGLICEGFATKYNEVDAAGEFQAPGALNDVGETWFAQKEPLVLFNHGLDPALTTRPIGRGISYKLQSDGLYTKIFIPRDTADAWQDKRAQRKFKEVYEGIKSGLINGLSVGGSFLRVGKQLLRWSMSELSVTPAPCLPSATFSLGSKAVIDRYGAVPVGLGEDLPQEQSQLGQVTRRHWNSIMGFAKQDNDHALHDHLLAREPAFQGRHDSEDCSICADRRQMMGVKAQQDDDTGLREGDEMERIPQTETGGKGVWSTAMVNDFPDSSFAYVEDGEKDKEGKTTPRSKRHLPYKDASGKPDAAHVRNALARLNQADIPSSAKASALKKLRAAASTLGIEVSDESGSGGKFTRDDIRAAADLSALDAAEVLTEAQQFLAEFNRGVKAGARHSKQTKDAIRQVIAHLTDTFGLAESHDGEEDTE